MKYIFLFLGLWLGLGAEVVSRVESVEGDSITIKTDTIDKGVTGYVVRDLGDSHATILNLVEVMSFDRSLKIATLKLKEFQNFENSALPLIEYDVKEGDRVILAPNYDAALLIAPTLSIFRRITESSPHINWLHPDIFAAYLSVEGRPTPRVKEFRETCSETATGLVFLFLDQKLFSLDCQNFKILNISPAELEQREDNIELPFFNRFEEIRAGFFGIGRPRLDSYEPHYYALMVKNNKEHKELFEIVNSHESSEISALAKEFKIKE